MATATGTKEINCFFITDKETLCFSKIVDTSVINCEAEAINQIIRENNLNPYHLSFVLDNGNVTYKAEYLLSLEDFQTREHLLNGNCNKET
jgi:Mg2+/Co2+ transporter CorC